MTTTNNVTMEKDVRLTANGRKYKINVRMSFEDVSKAQLLSWAFQSQVISMQRALRECTTESLVEMEADGYEVHALNAGTKPRTNAEVLAETKAVIATLSPEQREALVAELLDGVG